MKITLLDRHTHDGTLSAANYVTLTAAINTWMTSLTQARRP
jgi:hypothetical protein